jgi:hypothetical protein
MLLGRRQVVPRDRRRTVDELEQNPATVDSADVRRHGPDDLEPTEAAELYIALFPVNRSGGRADIPDPGPPGSAAPPGPPSPQRAGPAVEFGVKVPSAQAGKLLRLAERVMPLRPPSSSWRSWFRRCCSVGARAIRPGNAISGDAARAQAS